MEIKINIEKLAKLLATKQVEDIFKENTYTKENEFQSMPLEYYNNFYENWFNFLINFNNNEE